MNIAFLYIVVFIQFLAVELAYSQESNLICWEKNLELKWEYFQGDPPTKLSTAKAGCASIIKAEGYWDDDLPNYYVSNCFDKSISWTIDTTSKQLLEHEKLHFDISEIHARYIRKSIDSLRNEGINNVDIYSGLINHYLNERKKVDSIFDKETAHGVYLSKQVLWEKQILDELKLLSEFSNSNIK